MISNKEKLGEHFFVEWWKICLGVVSATGKGTLLQIMTYIVRQWVTQRKLILLYGHRLYMQEKNNTKPAKGFFLQPCCTQTRPERSKLHNAKSVFTGNFSDFFLNLERIILHVLSARQSALLVPAAETLRKMILTIRACCHLRGFLAYTVRGAGASSIMHFWRGVTRRCAPLRDPDARSLLGISWPGDGPVGVIDGLCSLQRVMWVRSEKSQNTGHNAYLSETDIFPHADVPF